MRRADAVTGKDRSLGTLHMCTSAGVSKRLAKGKVRQPVTALETRADKSEHEALECVLQRKTANADVTSKQATNQKSKDRQCKDPSIQNVSHPIHVGLQTTGRRRERQQLTIYGGAGWQLHVVNVVLVSLSCLCSVDSRSRCCYMRLRFHSNGPLEINTNRTPVCPVLRCRCLQNVHYGTLAPTRP